MIQLITPNPDIPCQPGWCLQYVRQAYGLPARYASATEAWENSATQHTGRDVPAGVWTPVWYAVDGVPEGHVALAAPDGSVYSTTDSGTSTAHHHPDLADLEAHYARYGPALTWRGWTEDVAGTPVITADTSEIAAMSSTTITPAPTEQGFLMTLSDKTQADMADNSFKTLEALARVDDSVANILKSVAFQEQFSVKMFEEIASKTGVTVDSAAIAADIRAQLAAQIGGK